MFVFVLCLALTQQVLSRAVLSPPQDIHVEQWQVKWTPATDDQRVKHTVQFSRFDTDEWLNVSGCVGISSDSCDATAIKEKDELGCVKLRVWAAIGRLRSSAVEACSRHGDSCTPELSLTALPGSLTVHLNRNHSLAQEYADNAWHRVYYGKEGEPLEDYEDDVSSVTINGLEVGQRYCMKMQYIYMNHPVGLPSCPQCELIPEPKPVQTGVIVAVVIVVLLTSSSVLILYVFIFHYEKIKQGIRCFLPPCKISLDISNMKHYSPPSDPIEERYDPISVLSPLKPAE